MCINYLGRGSLAPVEERQEALSEGYGFDCTCPRCTAELQHYSITARAQVRALVQQPYAVIVTSEISAGS